MPEPGSRFAAARRWGLKAGYSVADQALASVSNFALNVLLARTLSESRYGAFGVAFTIFLVLSGIHNALILEPISVFGPSRYADSLVPYLRRVTVIHLWFTAGLAIVGIAGGLIFCNAELKPVFVAMAATSPAILLFWLARRAHYLEFRPDLASMSSLIYCIVLGFAVGLLYLVHMLNGVLSFVALGIASLAASAFSARKTGVDFQLSRSGDVRATAAEMWNFGRWILPSALFFPLIAQVQMLWTSALDGLSAAGAFRALQNPVLPVVQVQTALGTLGLPVLAREFATGHTRAMLRRSIFYVAALGGVALLYEIAVLLTGGLWDRVLYGGKFATYDWLMPILGIMPVAVALATGCSVVLRAMLRPGLTTVTHIVGGVFGLIISYFWIRRAGVTGAVYALTASQVVTAAISLILISVAFRITKSPAAESKSV
jgi:O-antigen/teichoic acid export membrane protein